MYNTEIINSGGTSFLVKTKDYEFLIDPEGPGVSPPAALLASIGSCFGVYVRKYADGAKLELKDFSINVSGELSSEKPVCFREIIVTLDLKGAQLDDRRKHALLEFIKNCPVHNTLKVDPDVKIQIV